MSITEKTPLVIICDYDHLVSGTRPGHKIKNYKNSETIYKDILNILEKTCTVWSHNISLFDDKSPDDESMKKIENYLTHYKTREYLVFRSETYDLNPNATYRIINVKSWQLIPNGTKHYVLANVCRHLISPDTVEAIEKERIANSELKLELPKDKPSIQQFYPYNFTQFDEDHVHLKVATDIANYWTSYIEGSENEQANFRSSIIDQVSKVLNSYRLGNPPKLYYACKNFGIFDPHFIRALQNAKIPIERIKSLPMIISVRRDLDGIYTKLEGQVSLKEECVIC